MRGGRKPRLTQGGAGSGGGYVRSQRTYVLRRVLLVALLLLLAFAAMRTCQSLVNPAESNPTGGTTNTSDDNSKKDSTEKNDTPAKPSDDGLAGISPKSPLDSPAASEDESAGEPSENKDESLSVETASPEDAGVGTEQSRDGIEAGGVGAADNEVAGVADLGEVQDIEEPDASVSESVSGVPVVDADSSRVVGSSPLVGGGLALNGESVVQDSGGDVIQGGASRDLVPVVSEVPVLDRSVVRAERQSAGRRDISRTTSTVDLDPIPAGDAPVEPVPVEVTPIKPEKIEPAPIEAPPVETGEIAPTPPTPEAAYTAEPPASEPSTAETEPISSGTELPGPEPASDAPQAPDPQTPVAPQDVPVVEGDIDQAAGGASVEAADGKARIASGGVEVTAGPKGASIEVAKTKKGKAGRSKGHRGTGKRRGNSLNVEDITIDNSGVNVGVPGAATP